MSGVDILDIKQQQKEVKMSNYLISLDFANNPAFSIIEYEKKEEEKYSYTILLAKQFEKELDLINCINDLLQRDDLEIDLKNSKLLISNSSNNELIIRKLIKKPLIVDVKDYNTLFLNNRMLVDDKRFFIADFEGRDFFSDTIASSNIENLSSLYLSFSVGLFYGETILTKKSSRFWSDEIASKANNEKIDSEKVEDFIESMKIVNS